MLHVNRAFPILFLLAGCFTLLLEARAQIPYQVVPLTAQITTAPPSITISWPQDPAAPFYEIRRREPNESTWQEIAILPGTAIGYTDVQVNIGDVREYAVIRSASLPVRDTLCVPYGTNVTFNIFDTGGNGLCCWNSDGSWELYACDELIASGAKYEFQDQHQFIMCGSETCDEVVVVIYPDHQFEEISWEVTTTDGTIIGQGAPQMAPMFGYILAGIDAPVVEQQGTILLLVDQQHAPELEVELERLRMDLIGEGWLVLRADVDSATAVLDVKQVILDAAAEHDLRALLLIGDIPVPYSGKVAPDDHDDHLGAWPADLYYAELDGPWTDEELDWTAEEIWTRNHNVPGDGKFDQSTLPSDVDLIMGRIDLSDLPVYPDTEVELLRNYLDRNHAFRTGLLTFQRKAVIDENFPDLDHESAVYRSCIPMFGADSVYEGGLFSDLAAQPHLWAMAGGPGSYSSALGVGTSQDLVDYPLQGAFAHMLGSYFGDWDTQNNFMRSTLASGSMLGVVWGLQEMVFHHMAMGLPIGESVRYSQNARYNNHERHGRLIHVSLMGDPTLTLFPVAPVATVSLEIADMGIQLSWTPVQEDIIGYNIYRRNDPNVLFERINDAPLITTEHLDTDPPEGQLEYMVRVVKREQTASGTYQVLSRGTWGEITNTVGIEAPKPFGDLTVFPSPSQGLFTVRSAGLLPDTEIQLFDLAGNEIPVSITRGAGEFILQTHAAPGPYLLRIGHSTGLPLHRVIGIVR